MDVWSNVPAENLIKREEKMFLDLPKMLIKQASELGVLPDHIEDVSTCTVCDERYSSYRRDAPKTIEAQVAYLGWKL